MRQNKILNAIVVTAALFYGLGVRAQDPQLVKPACLTKEPVIGGNYNEEDPKFDDMTLLTETLKTDMRIWGFQVCLDKAQGILAGFRL